MPEYNGSSGIVARSICKFSKKSKAATDHPLINLIET